jgi:hypothetical protein
MGSCYYKSRVSAPGSAVVGDGEVEEPGGLTELERREDRLLASGGRGALCDLSVGGGEGDQVHPVEFVADVAPAVVCGVLDNPHEQQCEPAQLDVCPDPVFAVVEDRAESEGALHVAPAAFDLQQGLVGGGEVFGSEGGVGGAQQPFAVQVGLAFDRGRVDAKQPAVGAAQVTPQPGLGLQRAEELVAATFGPGVGAGHQLLEVRDETASDRGVAVGLLGVVTDHEPLRPSPLIPVALPAGRDRDFLHAQVMTLM